MNETREPVPTVQLGDRWVGERRPCYVVAEIGTNFNGDLDLAKRSIEVAAERGADAVKFQTFHADEFVADRTLSYTYCTHDGRKVTENQYEMFKRLELPEAWHAVLRDHAADRGVHFFSSVADRRAVDLLDSLGAPAFKLASEDLINVALLEYVADKGRPVILSTGMADLEEIAGALDVFGRRGRTDLILLHCVSAYPTPPSSCNLRRISALRARFNLPTGFSDHTEGWQAASVAVGLEACLIEKHFTLDRHLLGPDHAISADPETFGAMVEQIRLAETLLGRSDITYDPVEEQSRNEFRRSIVAGKTIHAGQVIREELLAYKRPGLGLRPYQRDLILGKRARRTVQPNDLITLDDVEPSAD